MSDEQTIQQAVTTFNNLSGEDIARLEELNNKIQNHAGKWAERKGGERGADGKIQMYWIKYDPIIFELLEFMEDKGLLVHFKWTEWDEGSKLFASNEPTKYDNIDAATALMLISVASRKERVAEGTLAWAFESGGFVKLVNRLVSLKKFNSDDMK